MSETVSSSVEKAPAARGKVTVNGKTYYWGTGRRKSSVARVRITAGEGNFLVNKRTVDEFFTEPQSRTVVRAPLFTANAAAGLDVTVNVKGGGITGQAGAIVQGLGRALALYDASLRKDIQSAGFLTRDSRMKERKKYGLRGARRAFQFSKR
ncbi:MAG: 30S ribosomal protein S9 [Phycisphaerales bacterium]|nr:30S ribosomal protein S9 [Phycisphaerales bacterium]